MNMFSDFCARLLDRFFGFFGLNDPVQVVRTAPAQRVVSAGGRSNAAHFEAMDQQYDMMNPFRMDGQLGPF